MSYYDNFGEIDFDDPRYPQSPVFPHDHRETGQEGKDDGKFDEEAGIPCRLKRLFRVYDVLKGHDMSALRWDCVGTYEDDPGSGPRRMPPPPDDPRTQLPEIFGFRGFNRYKSPAFYIRDDHPPCYPQELVGRLKALHESGKGGQRVESVSYAVSEWYEDMYGDPSSDEDDSGEDEELCRSIGVFDTLELANDAVMTALEKEFSRHLIFQESIDDEGTPDFNCGLHQIVPEGQESKLLYDGEAGVTWHLDEFGRLRLTGHGDYTSTFRMETIRREPAGTCCILFLPDFGPC